MTTDNVQGRLRRLPLTPMRKPTPTTFDGTKLRALRETAGYSAEDLADKADPHLRHDVVAIYEAGQRQPTFERLNNIAAALEVTLSDLLNANLATSAHHWHREAAGLSHDDVATKLGVHRATIKRWDLTGNIAPRHIQACADLYRTTVATLTDPSDRVTVTLTPEVAIEVDRRRQDQPRDRYLTELIAKLVQGDK